MNQKGLEPMLKRVSALCPQEDYEWIEEQAAKQRRSIADIVRMIIEYARESGWGEQV